MNRRLLAAALVSVTVLAAPATPPAAATRNAQVMAKRGMVASAHALASQAGLEMLKAGGNAVDAAVAAAFAIGVVEPNASGIGGEGMMVIYLAATGRAVAIDYRSAAPAAADFPDGIPETGHAAVAVPGTVAGLTLALQKYGTMPLSRVLAPAIRLAEQGFVDQPNAGGRHPRQLRRHQEERAARPPALPRRPAARGGRHAEEPRPRRRAFGRLPPAARTSSTRARSPRPSPPRWPRRAAASRRPTSRPTGPSSASRCAAATAGTTSCRRRRRSAAIALIEILQILGTFDLSKEAPLSPRYVHLVAEAMKRGFADYAAAVGDPDFVKVPVAELLSPGYAKARAAEIEPDAITPKVAAGAVAKQESPSTTSLSVVDAQGNMVALTQTISDFFGAKVVVDGTGIILNNEMKNFSSRGPNAMAPGKRMRTTIAPTILLKDGTAFAALGTPGAARIVSTMALLVSNLVDFGMGMQEAIEAPRFYARDTEADLSVEGRMPPATASALAKLGYSIKTYRDFDLFFGGAQGIVIDPKTGLRVGGADPRRDGAVVGY